MKKIGGYFILGFIILLAACNAEGASTSSDEGKIGVVTTIAQIAEPLSVIGGEHIHVESLMGPSIDPHVYNATQSDMTKIEKADVIFYNGLNLEANMTSMLEKIAETKPAVAVGNAIPQNSLLKDDKGSVDPHIWFDIDLWQNALDSAVETLKKHAPEHADYFEENKQDYFSQLAALKKDAAKLVDIPEKQRYLVTAHDAFGYFGRMHDLHVIGLQGLSTEDEVGVSDINDTIAIIEKYQVPAIFVESSINANTIEAVLEGAKSKGMDVSIGGELFSDAMGKPGTEEGTYLGMYRHNIETIYQALSGGAKQ
ncbi:zinc ABC transporter substrate-binding protein [Virgibacillus sp. 179-BFC.A HS]|uniref:Zinc ABC transporter substrate-binding protein n=1 Tax=Tigheibacillus jepli TaxID=3035914 RepID=A0ABU5CJA8_9BACI|nr:zinc ABC transporter substrate-binding protein [Virgibacillus sp. 179-BFC.A HS]MDY0406442.1 zinc ABC transporter substrate-binding protein [Virgibacillus sp. 179-BFC.A HS]